MRLIGVLVLLLVCSSCLGAVSQLSAYNVNISDSSVSGLSSGAYFATQMQVAYSSMFRGAGIFAGGPYDCAQGVLSTALFTCMKTTTGKPDVAASISTTNSRAAAGELDDPSFLARHKVYLYSGTKDTTVMTAVMDALEQYYESFLSKDSILYETTIPSGHTQPTNDSSNNPNCGRTQSPYVSYCEYDGAGVALQHIYDNQLSTPSGSTDGDMIEFDQTEFLKGDGMATSGYVYVPKPCSSGSLCRLHIALHGCVQSVAEVGTAYIDGSGYNEWADANNFIVLYPQIKATHSNPSNPNGCWNWWGYNNDVNTYDTNKGSQMQAIMQMMKRISSNFSPIAAPTSFKATSVTNSSVGLQWSSVSGAAGYSLQRNRVTITEDLITATSYNDTGLMSGTTYQYDLVAITSQGAASPAVGLSVTTTGPPPPLSAPADLQTTSVTSSSISITWDSVAGASLYLVTRNGTQLSNVSDTSYTDTGLSAETTYAYTVAAVDIDGTQGPSSEPLVAATSSSWQCESFYDNNYNHVEAGRATVEAGFCYAVGSNDPMGLWNVATYTSLAETAPGYYEVGKC